MAQTKRKRKTKHRGTAGGTVVARGRTGRKLTEDERKGAKSTTDRRAPRHEKPPTWKGSLQRGAIVTAVFAVIMVVISKNNRAGVIVILPVVLLVYTAMGYYTDLWLHRRWLRKQAGG